MHAKHFSESLAPNVLSIHLVEMVARVLGENYTFVSGEICLEALRIKKC